MSTNVKIILGTGATPEAIIDANAREENDVLRADVRPLLEALGYKVHAQHIATQGKVYIELPAADPDPAATTKPWYPYAAPEEVQA